MNSIQSSRRNLLMAGAAGALAVPTPALAQAPRRWASRLSLENDGIAEFDYVRWNPFLTPPPDFSGLPPGAEVRVHSKFPYEDRDVFETFVYVPTPQGNYPISLIYMEIDNIQLASPDFTGNRRTIAFTGKVISNPVQSPFGELVGRPVMLAGTFSEPGNNARFEFFGGFVAGSHATITNEAFGSLDIKGSWRSF